MKIAVDASALVAVLLKEPEVEYFLTRLLAASAILLSPVNWWEVQVRIRTVIGEAGEAQLAAILDDLRIQVHPITMKQAEIAYQAFRNYHQRPARLNLGDCFAYALAKDAEIPLLFKGNDFHHTDVPIVP